MYSIVKGSNPYKGCSGHFKCPKVSQTLTGGWDTQHRNYGRTVGVAEVQVGWPRAPQMALGAYGRQLNQDKAIISISILQTDDWPSPDILNKEILSEIWRLPISHCNDSSSYSFLAINKLGCIFRLPVGDSKSGSRYHPHTPIILMSVISITGNALTCQFAIQTTQQYGVTVLQLLCKAVEHI